jgi:hypothetical protein
VPATPDISKERELLMFVYAAFNRRDIAAILPKMHPEVEWPNGMEGGWVHGYEEVRAYWTRQWARIDPHVEPVRSCEWVGAFGPNGSARLLDQRRLNSAHGNPRLESAVRIRFPKKPWQTTQS